MIKKIFIYAFFLLLAPCIYGQRTIVPPPDPDVVRLEKIGRLLEELVEQEPAFGAEIDITSGKVDFSDFARNIARAAGVNITVRNVPPTSVTFNLTRARIDDLLMYLCSEYGLDMSVTGNILTLFSPSPALPVPPDPDITFSVAGNKLSYNLSGENLIDVVRKISGLTGVNIVAEPAMYNQKISGYVNRMPFDEAVENLFAVNNIRAVKSGGSVWHLEPDRTEGAGSFRNLGRLGGAGSDELYIDSLGMVTARIKDIMIGELLVYLCENLGVNYFFLDPVSARTGVYVREVELEHLLDVLFTGTDFGYYRERGIYYFGAAGREGKLFSVAHIPMRYRSVNTIEQYIPDVLRGGLQIKTFPDQNAIIAAGDSKLIARLENFLASVDLRVPLINIEVIIMEVTKSFNIEAGLGLGVGNAPVTSGGTLSPGIDYKLNAGSVNSILNGFGSVNLGRLNPDFYVNLKLLEENGDIKISSTPKLSTLNGHEASLKSGEKRYYKETTSNIIGTQNPMQTESFVWRDVEANLSVSIHPYVSADGEISLEIEIEQSEFTTQEENSGPYRTATRSFKSQVRVANGETVLLGGIDRNTFEKKSSGLPFIARVPVLRWIFGKRSHIKSDTCLTIIIKPSLIE